MTRQAENRNERAETNTRDEAPRKRRSRLGDHRSVLEAEVREGYHRLWVNDYPEGHLQTALDSGYMFTKAKDTQEGNLRGHELGSMRSEVVGTKPDGSPMRGFLMEIKQEWHDEDMAENLKHAQDIDDQIRGGTAGDDGNEHGSENRYTPDGGTKYNT
jgi:hypothetical protein